MTTTIDLGITEKEYKELQEIYASINMTVDEAISYFFKTVINRKDEILARYQNGEPSEQIMETVVADVVNELFGDRNG